MTWKRDPRSVREAGGFTVWSEVNTDRETSHVVHLPDGRELRILPDGDSGHIRAQRLRQVLDTTAEVCDGLVADSGHLVLIGALVEAGLSWERVETVETCGECGRPL